MKLSNLTLLAAGALLFLGTVPARAEGDSNQVFYRYGSAHLKNARGNQVFTDTDNALGTLPNNTNNGTSGFNVGAGLDIDMIKELGPGDLLGEIQATYSHYSANNVDQAVTALSPISKTVMSNVTVSGLEVVVAPKYRFAFLDGKLRPWIVPIGLAFLVNSPPSDNTTYLDVGLQFGVGVEYEIIRALSLGADFRYTTAFKEPNVDMTHNSVDVYAGINF